MPFKSITKKMVKMFFTRPFTILLPKVRWWYTVFVLFSSPEHLQRSQSYLNSCHVNISFTIENKSRMSFLDVKIIRKQGKFTTSVSRRPTLRGIYTHFDSSLSSTKNIDMFYALLYRCFRICPDWTKFIFDRNGGQFSTLALRTLHEPYITPGLLHTGFSDFLVLCHTNSQQVFWESCQRVFLGWQQNSIKCRISNLLW